MRWAEGEKLAEELRSGLTRPDPAELPGSEARHVRGGAAGAVRERLQQPWELEGGAPRSQCARRLQRRPCGFAGRQGVDRLGCSAPADLTLSTCRVTGKDKGPPPPAGSPSGGERGRPGGRLRASSEDVLVYVCTRCDINR